MPLTEEEKKERNRQKQKRWYAANKELAKKNRHARYLKNKDKELSMAKAYRENNKESLREYYRNRRRTDKGREQAAKWREDNKDYMKDYGKDYYQKNKQTINASNAKWKKDNQDKCKLNNKRYFKKQRINLTDSYVRGCLVQKSDLNYSDIPQSLIEAKRAELKGSRIIKEQENG